jgi:hypothetical protein
MTMRYAYRCPVHGPIDSEIRADLILCDRPYIRCEELTCMEEAKRDWGFHVDLSFEPYFAPSFGTVVKSRTHAKDLAKIASEEATLRTGVPHDYAVVDTHDDAAVGINTDEKKAEQENSRRFAVNGAAWSEQRLKEIADAKAKVTEERNAKKALADA